MRQVFWGSKLRAAKGRGFSLIIVLIIALVGFATIGGIMQFMIISSSVGRRASASSHRYNALEEGLEFGKARLKEHMYSMFPPPRYFDKTGTPESNPIKDPDDLLLTDVVDYQRGVYFELGNVSSRDLGITELAKCGISSITPGKLYVKIYDMQYNPARIDPTLTNNAEKLKLLPPSILATGENAFGGRYTNTYDPQTGITTQRPGGAENTGVYLIRAMITVSGKPQAILETAVLQSNNT